MTFESWVGLFGALLLLVALASAYLKLLPVSASMLYLGAGVALGVGGLGLLDYRLVAISNWLERATALVVIVSLFVGGLKLRLPPLHPSWMAAYRLAGPAMLLTIAGVAAVGRYAYSLSWPTALLLGAILAPTDPVLASEVSVRNARDHDRLRYGLSGEAGLNDGAAFPFVLLALGLVEHEGASGAWLLAWLAEHVTYGILMGLAVGYLLGRVAGRAAITVRARTQTAGDKSAGDFLALALIFLAYWAGEALHALGFLSVFAAGLGLRHTEVLAVRQSPPPPKVEPGGEPESPDASPAEQLVERDVDPGAMAHPAVASGVVLSEVLTFGETLERLLGVLIVIVTGVLVSRYFELSGLLLAGLLFVVIRPAAAAVGLLRTPTTLRQRALLGWFGMRGIGSLYYIAFAIGEGIGPARAARLSGLVVTTVAASVLLHGASVTPVMAWYERVLARRKNDSPEDTA